MIKFGKKTKAAVLVSLFNHATPKNALNKGVIMTEELVSDSMILDWPGSRDVATFHGRNIYISFSGDEFDPALYDSMNGAGMARQAYDEA